MTAIFWRKSKMWKILLIFLECMAPVRCGVHPSFVQERLGCLLKYCTHRYGNNHCHESARGLQFWLNGADLKMYKYTHVTTQTKVFKLSCQPKHCHTTALPFVIAPIYYQNCILAVRRARLCFTCCFFEQLRAIGMTRGSCTGPVTNNILIQFIRPQKNVIYFVWTWNQGIYSPWQ